MIMFCCSICHWQYSSITARRLEDSAEVTDMISYHLLAQAKVESSLAEVDDIEWKEGNVEDFPFED